jgi:PQQ-like domain
LEHAGTALAYFGGDGKRRWRAPVIGRSGDAAEALIDGPRLLVVLYDAISCGTTVLALDRASGAIVWQADVDQISVGHSKYAHRASLKLRGNDVVLTDVQSGGCSLQTFERANGRRRLSVKKQNW